MTMHLSMHPSHLGPLRSIGAFAACILALALMRIPVAHAEAQEALTPEEQSRLAAGELVVRSSTRRQGSARLVGGTSWQIIDAPPNVVWQTLLDTENYTETLPRVVSAQVVEAMEGGNQLVRLEHKAGPLGASYFLRVKAHQELGNITFAVDDSRPHSINAAWGFYNVRSLGQNRTLLTYGVMADIGQGLFTKLVSKKVQRSMLKVPSQIKRFVEAKGIAPETLAAH